MEPNYLSDFVRGVGLFLWALAFVLALLGGIGIWILRHDRPVQMAQPIFLMAQCAGSILTGASIVTLSWDEGAGWTDSQLDIACVLTPWFFFVG